MGVPPRIKRRRASGLERAVQRYLTDQQARVLAACTKVYQERSLNRFVVFAKKWAIRTPTRVTSELIEAFGAYLAHDPRARWDGGLTPLAAATRLVILGYVRSFFEALVRTGGLLLNPALGVDLPRVSRRPAPVMATAADVQRLVSLCPDDTALSLRNRAVIELLFGCGLRRSELTNLDLADVDLDRGVVLVRRGKGGTSRSLPLAGAARRAVARYIERARDDLAADASEPALIVSQQGGRMNPDSICQGLRRLVERARIRRKLSPHAFRHGFATELLRGGADLVSVQRLLGHARSDTTQRYTHLSTADIRAVYERTHPRARMRARRSRDRQSVALLTARRGEAP